MLLFGQITHTLNSHELNSERVWTTVMSRNEVTLSQTQACVPRFWPLNCSGFKRSHTNSELLAASKKQFKDRECMSQKLGWELQGFIPCFQIKACQDKTSHP